MTWIILCFFGGFIVIVGMTMYCLFRMSKKDEAHQLAEELLNEDYLNFMPGIKRDDLERLLVNEPRWKCCLCQLDNIQSGSTCSLCGAFRGSNVANGATMQDHQKEASTRRQWKRTKVSTGSMQWLLDDGEFTRKAFTLQITGTDGEVNGTRGTLTWQLLEEANAHATVLGSKLSTNMWATLASVSAKPFSMKYAWLLDQTNDMTTRINQSFIDIKTTRKVVLVEAIDTLQNLDGDQLCAAVRCQFKGEAAIDAGAVQREWYMLVAQSFMSTTSGLFALSNRDTNSYFINPNSAKDFKNRIIVNLFIVLRDQHNSSSDHLGAFQAAGRFMGRALLNGQVIPFRLSSSIFKSLLGIPITIHDIENIDPIVYRSLLYIERSDCVDELALSFAATACNENGVEEVNLVPNGRNRAVTDANKVEYINLMTRHFLFGRIQHQLNAFIRGVYDIVPPELLIPFDHKELEMLVCGVSIIDVSDWRANTVVSPNLRRSRVLTWFWEILESMSSYEQETILQFATGSSRVPVQGFKGLTSYDGQICYFTLKGFDYTKDSFPRAHACYNRLDLPLYPKKQLMEKAFQWLLQTDPMGFSLK